MSGVQDRLQAVPVGTLALVLVNVAVHCAVFITSFNPGLLAISAYQVVYLHEYYRIVTAAFTHGGILHILMNMMSLLQLGALLEKSFGTVIFLLLSVWAIVLCGTLYVLANWAASAAVSGSESQLYSSAVGYSGVLFSYAVISSYHTTAPTQSVFGLFSVPSKVYPWILLGIMQIILPNISLLGHLSGIVVGLLAAYGPVDLLLLPSRDFCRELDDSASCCGLTKRSNYCRTSDVPVTTDSCGGCGSAAWRSLVSGVSFIARIVWNVIATVFHIIGCPASVTSFSCCSAVIERVRRSVSSCFNRQRYGSYDAVSDGNDVVGGGLSSMQTTGGRIASRSPILGGGGARYDRLRTTEINDDLERGVDDRPLGSSDSTTAGDSGKRKDISDGGAILSL